MQREAIPNYTGTIGANWDCPGQRGTYGHPTTYEQRLEGSERIRKDWLRQGKQQVLRPEQGGAVARHAVCLEEGKQRDSCGKWSPGGTVDPRLCGPF